MNRANRFTFPLAVAAAWAAAGSALLPLWASGAFGALCILALPGLCIERALSGEPAPDGVAEAPARWLTFSVAAISLVGLAVSVAGGEIHELLLCLAVLSIVSAVFPTRTPLSTQARENDHVSRAPGDRAACTALLIVIVVSVVLAAAAPNVARDRMWYLAFLTRLGSGTPIDWTEPFLGTGAIAPRFAYNGWLLSLAAWSALTGTTPSIVFERLAPPLLTVVVASAAWAFGRRTVRSAPGLAALASMATILATRFPFFSPDHYPFFARIAEDKSVALLVFAPVAVAILADAVETRSRKHATTWAPLALSFVAVAFSHGLVMFLVGIMIATLLLTTRSGGTAPARRVLAALALAAVVAAVPGRMAILARSQIVDADEPSAAWSQDVTNPVVRAHRRLERTRSLPLGGPIVEPLLLADPLLIAGLAGIVVAWLRRRDPGAALLAAASVPFAALAFVPFVAPLFGKLVLPWMAYRALWLIPFGSLLAFLLVSVPGGATTYLVRGSAGVLLAITLVTLPWNRANARPDVIAPLRNADTSEILARIAMLPPDARITAASGFAELVPALAGRAVVAVADRGTFVFAGSSAAAEERLRATAAIVGLAPGSPAFRRMEAQRAGATHFVVEGPGCGRLGRELFRSGRLHLCAVRPVTGDGPDSRTSKTAAIVEATSPHTHSLRAVLDAGVRCMPAPERKRSSDGTKVYRWKRESRWTAKPVVIRCRATMKSSDTAGLALTVSAELPRARETIILRAVLRTDDGRKIVRHAMLSLGDRSASTISLPDAGVRSLRLRLTPAYLPYLNLRELSLWERGGVRE